MAGKCKLQCNEGEDFALTDVLCFLQDSNWQLPIPPGEVAAPRKCICELTRNAIERLQQPDFIIRCDPVLQCELNTFTQCLRKEEER